MKTNEGVSDRWEISITLGGAARPSNCEYFRQENLTTTCKRNEISEYHRQMLQYKRSLPKRTDDACEVGTQNKSLRVLSIYL